MLKSSFRLVFSKISLPLWLVIILSMTVPALGAQPYRATSKFTVIGPNQATGTISVNPTALTVTEGGPSQSFTISLGAEPTADVIISLDSAGDCTVSVPSVTLNSVNWQAGVSMSVTAVDDDIVNGTRTCTVTTTSSVSEDPDYDGIDPEDVSVSVQDNDTAGIHVSQTAFTISEASELQSKDVVITLLSQPTAPVTIQFSSSDTAKCTVTPTSVILHSGNWNAGATITVSAVDNQIVDGTRTCVVTTSVDTSDTIYGSQPVSNITATVLDNDSGEVKFTQTNYAVDEGVGVATIGVELTAEFATTVTVDYATSHGTAGVGDYTPESGTLTFAPSDLHETFQVTITDDTLVEPDETITLHLSNPTGGATLGAPSTATLTILDNDLPTVQFSQAQFTIGEGAGVANVSVTLSQAVSDTVTVLFSTSSGTATAPGDYTAVTNHLVTFNPDDATSATVPVTIVDDSVDESDETVNLLLTSPVNATLGAQSSATLTIIDNDPQPTVRFSSATYDVNEDAGSRTITILLSGPSGHTVTVDYATSNGTATAGTDYEFTSGTATFPDNQTSYTFEVPIIDDNVNEPDESINLTLSNPQHATLVNPNSATLYIRDDDLLPSLFFADAAGQPSPTYTINEGDGVAVITVNLSGPSALVVTVAYQTTSGGTATPGSDYTPTSGVLVFAPFQTSRTFSVPIIDDDDDDDGETIHLALSNPLGAPLGTPSTAVLTIIDNDGPPTVQFQQATYSVDESQLSAVITVTLSAQSTSDITVAYAAQPGTATVGEDFLSANGVLEFPSGQMSNSFEVLLLPDQLDEPDETVLLTLNSPINATLGAPAEATLIILDNDPLPSVSFTISNLFISENDGLAVLPVRVDPVSGKTVTVDYETVAGTATEGSDYEGVSGTLTFSPGDTIKIIQVPILADTPTEPNEMFTVQLNGAVNATLTTPAVSTVTIVDGDRALFTQIMPSFFQRWDVDEPNDGCSMAYEVKIGETYQFLPDDYIDYYFFTLTEAADVLLEVTNFTPLSGQSIVWKIESCSDAANAETVGNNGTLGSDKSIDIGFLEPGNYYIGVINDSAPSVTQPYYLRVVINNE